ncbi:MAG TPA: hydrogenase maturation protease [Isosphaeraceae bacterium]|jgi:hydrogenase maturation protease|nr:hydrogenase maturation protease [Isosphaeraceae bacterium]
MTTARGDVLVVGLGSPHGDDQVGWAVVERLRPLLPPFATARAVGGGLDLLACLEGQDAAIVVDAAAPSGRPGRVHVLDWPCPDLVALRPLSTHGPGLVEALRLAEVLGRLPRRVRIYAVEVVSVRPGADLGPIATGGVDAVTMAILADLARGGPGAA